MTEKMEQSFRQMPPNRLFMENGIVWTSKPNIDAQLLKPKRGRTGLTRSKELMATSWGDWTCIVKMNYSNNFESREEFDGFICSKSGRKADPRFKEIIKEIPIEVALEKWFDVKLSANMYFYFSSKDKLEKDLNRPLPFDSATKPKKLDETVKSQLAKELFYKNMCRIFCVEDHYERDSSSFMINDFNLLHNNGYFVEATAKKEDYYLHFFYVTS